MSAVDLLADLAQRGIELQAHGDRLRYAPRSEVTPDLVDRMKAHKGELLAILRAKCDKVTESDGYTIATDTDPWDSPTAIPASSVEPCPTCGSLELWESAAGNLGGLTRGVWRCLHCDPPTEARRLLLQLTGKA